MRGVKAEHGFPVYRCHFNNGGSTVDIKEEGKQEGKLEQAILSIVELLEDYDSIPVEIIETLKNESNLEQLKKWHKLAAKVNSIQAFIDKM